MDNNELRDWMEDRFNALENQIRIKNEADAKALDLAQRALDERLGRMNEFRDQLNLERGSFLTREFYDKIHELLVGRVTSLELTRSNLEGRMWIIGGLSSVAVIVLNLIFLWIRK